MMSRLRLILLVGLGATTAFCVGKAATKPSVTATLVCIHEGRRYSDGAQRPGQRGSSVRCEAGAWVPVAVTSSERVRDGL